MEITHETRARIFGLYLGCEVYDAYNNKVGKLVGVSLEQFRQIKVQHETIWNLAIEEVQLLLSPLSAITEADAIACYELIFAPDAVARGEKINTVRTWIMRNVIPYQVADRLRELHYALPYGEVRDLFEARIAIEKTKKPQNHE